MKKIILIAVTALSVMACKSSTVEATKTTLEYLTAGSSKKWKVTDGTAVIGPSSINIVANSQPCQIDNLLILNKDMTYTLNEGATKCGTTDPDLILTDKWSLTETPKTISVSKFTFLNKTATNAVFNISSIDDNKFTGTTTVPYNGSNAIVTVEFSVVK